MDQIKLILYGFIFIGGVIVVSMKKVNKQKVTWVEEAWVYGALIMMVMYSI